MITLDTDRHCFGRTTSRQRHPLWHQRCQKKQLKSQARGNDRRGLFCARRSLPLRAIDKARLIPTPSARPTDSFENSVETASDCDSRAGPASLHVTF